MTKAELSIKIMLYLKLPNITRKEPAVKTKRLTIKPLDDRALTALRDRTQDANIRRAYDRRLAACIASPATRHWHTPWVMIATAEDLPVGEVSFRGPPNKHGEVEIGFGIFKRFEGRGYATEAIEAICRWGFSMPGCYFIRATTADGNTASERVLEKCGFHRAARMEGATLWERERPASATLPAFICFGMTIGLAVGMLAFGNMEIGICGGFIVGTAVGITLDIIDRRRRKRRGKADV